VTSFKEIGLETQGGKEGMRDRSQRSEVAPWGDESPQDSEERTLYGRKSADIYLDTGNWKMRDTISVGGEQGGRVVYMNAP